MYGEFKGTLGRSSHNNLDKKITLFILIEKGDAVAVTPRRLMNELPPYTFTF